MGFFEEIFNIFESITELQLIPCG